MLNQNPEQRVRDHIDKQLRECGWIIQSKQQLNLHAGVGVAVREYGTDEGPADYVLFVEAKPVGIIEAKREEEAHNITTHELQAERYAEAKLKHLENEKLPFVYVSTGAITFFTDFRDPKPRARKTFTFHRPETLRDWLKKTKSLRTALQDLDILRAAGLRDCQLYDCQLNAIQNLEASFKQNKPRALIQMATGAGKTFTAITAAYRLLKLEDDKRNNVVRRILFLVDTKNLGEQAEQEFLIYKPYDSNRQMSELYSIYRLHSKDIPQNHHVYISTIQRLYNVLKGQDMDESAEIENPNEQQWQLKEPQKVVYNSRVPIEFFDFIIIDECHRSIYNVWQQVLEYFDAFQIGLTATPDNRAFGYFQQNLVSEYRHEMAVADGVNVGCNVYLIETDISQRGATIKAGEYVEHREKLTRKKRMALQDEPEPYTQKQLDKSVVNQSQIRMVIQTFRDKLPEMFYDRYNDDNEFEVPKTLIFAKDDSHADDIIHIVREVFNEGNKFCQKITYKAEDPKSTLTNFRNGYYPRIAVTVDMIATGTDVKPLECLLFMRDVRSRNYFEQMKGRGTRIISLDNLRKVSPSAQFTKDHFVIVDAVGVCKSLKTDIRPLDQKPSAPIKDLLNAIAVNARGEELFTTLASRLTRLEKRMTDEEKKAFADKAGGFTIAAVTKKLLAAYDPDTEEEIKERIKRQNPHATTEVLNEQSDRALEKLRTEAAKIFTGDLNSYIENVHKIIEQKMDRSNLDTLNYAGWETENEVQAEKITTDFSEWIRAHKDEITALQIFYDEPYHRRKITLAMMRELTEKIIQEKPTIAPERVWRAYQVLDKAEGEYQKYVALVALIRRVIGVDDKLTTYEKTVRNNFQTWVMNKQAGALKFNDEQMKYLRLIRDTIANSLHFEIEDFDQIDLGERARAYNALGDDLYTFIDELNEALAA